MSSFSRGMRIGKNIVKYLLILLIVAINVLLIWRITSSSTPKSVGMLTVNDAVLTEYKKTDGLYMFTQEQLTHTYAEYNYGYFAIVQTVFIPDANQAQIVFRYNNGTLKSVAADYNLPDLPSRYTELFDVTLLAAIDLTPENKDDNDDLKNEECVKLVRIKASRSDAKTKNLYNYRKMVFDFEDTDIKAHLDDGTLLAVFADIFYINDVDYSARPYGTLCLYDYKSKIIEVQLKNQDVKAIRKYEDDSTNAN